MTATAFESESEFESVPPRLLRSDDPHVVSQEARRACVVALQAERQSGMAGRVVWIAPTLRAQKAITRQIVLDLGGACLAPPVITFDGFAKRLLQSAGHPATALSSTVRRLLLRRITRQMSSEGRLVHFRAVAETSGFLDVVEAFIRELKRDEIWPETFQATIAQFGTETARNRELGEIYTRYQQGLLDHDWYDSEGLFWLARTELQEGRCLNLPRWRWLGAIGFSDFTHTQYEILGLLAERTDRLVVSLPVEAGAARPSLFEKSAVAAFALQRVIPGLTPQRLEGGHDESADRRQLREWLFANPRETKPATRCESIQIIASTGIPSELTSVALRIKHWLRLGVQPTDIIVGLRSPQEDALTWHKGLREAGIPVWSEQGEPVSSAGLIKFLLSVLQNEGEDWPFSRLMAVLGSSYFLPEGYPGNSASDARAVSRVLRGLRLSQGRDDIRRGVQLAVERYSRLQGEQEAQREPDAPEDSLRGSIEIEIYRGASQLLEWFDQQTRSLRRSRTMSEWVDALDELLRQTGPLSAARNDLEHERRVWDQWQRLLRDAAAAEQAYLGRSLALSLPEFVAELRDLIADERCDPPPEPRGCVRILGLDQVRHLEVPYLVMAGLTEESFPRRRSDDCLFTDAERRELVRRGLPIRHETLHQQDELLFFFHAVLAAQRELVLTYPEVNQRGQPCYPTPYLGALRALWTSDALRISSEGELDPIPAPQRGVTSCDARLIAMQAARKGKPGWLRTLLEAPATRETISRLVAAIEMAAHRFDTHGFTEYEGSLSLPANQQWLAARFHPARQFSATELESFANCPFRFWLQTVLGVAPLGAAESGTDVLRRGVVVHDVLSRMIDELHPTADSGRVSAEFHRLVSERLQRELTPNELQRALLRIEDQLLSEWGTAFADQFEKYEQQVREAWGKPWQQSDPEVPFGDVPGITEKERRPPLELGSAENRVLVRGRVDRIDLGQAGDRSVFTVIDYKTGSRTGFSHDDVAAGRSLQLVLYAIAARRLGFVPADAIPFQFGYWCLKETGFRTGLKNSRKFQAIDEEVWQTLENMVDETIPRLVAGIRRGEFVVDNPKQDCTSFCDYRTMCRVNQIRPLADKLGKYRAAPVADDQAEFEAS